MASDDSFSHCDIRRERLRQNGAKGIWQHRVQPGVRLQSRQSKWLRRIILRGTDWHPITHPRAVIFGAKDCVKSVQREFGSIECSQGSGCDEDSQNGSEASF